MLRFVLQKIKNKKWMNFCLFAGISLLVGVFTCHPMFRQGAGSQLLNQAFADYAKEHQEYPAVFQKTGSLETADFASTEALFAYMDAYENKWQEYVAVPSVARQQSVGTGSKTFRSDLDRKYFLRVECLKDMDRHTEVIHGRGFDAKEASGIYPCVISESVMDVWGLVEGEILTLDLTPEVKFVIAGIVRESSFTDPYWHHSLSDYGKSIFVSEETMDALLSEGSFAEVMFEDNLLLDYTGIDDAHASEYCGYIKQFLAADSEFSANFLELLLSCEAQRKTAGMLLGVLELPEIVLLLLFLYMISTQMLDAEEGEIATLRSRGVTRRQVMWLYLLQALVLSLAGFLMGIVAGYGMCRLAARTDGFLRFVAKDVHVYTFTFRAIPYGLAACAAAVLFMTIPVWRRAEITIVEQKNRNHYAVKTPFWEKYFLDLALFGISCYLFYNYNRQSALLAQNAMEGKLPDPMVFLNASLFIFSVGLFFLRLLRYAIVGIDRLGKKHWSPAIYASFLQIERTFPKQSFLSVFLIMTIATGIFQANVARTMNENNEQRILYDIGTDARLTEHWTPHLTRIDEEQYLWYYDEPDQEPYRSLTEKGLCESVTRVIEEENVKVSAGRKELQQCQLLGIHTKEFGETARLLEGVNEEHWFYALNALAKDADGVIISRNMAESLKLSVGDTLSYTRNLRIPYQPDIAMGTATAAVCAIVDCFPGYDRYLENEEENYLVVANYATLVGRFGQTPYSVWLRMEKDAEFDAVLRELEAQGIEPIKISVTAEEIAASRSSSMIQITNGMFTMSFLISILICSAGFLIYWIMSLKKRELLFGIYRAMGMSMKEIRKMLLAEQVFGSLLPVLAGGGAGIIGTILFVRLVTLVYLPGKHNLAIRIFTNPWDMAKLFAVVALVAFVCFAVMQRLLAKMKIAEALKLGED